LQHRSLTIPVNPDRPMMHTIAVRAGGAVVSTFDGHRGRRGPESE
jgi:hypothetical protein